MCVSKSKTHLLIILLFSLSTEISSGSNDKGAVDQLLDHDASMLDSLPKFAELIQWTYDPFLQTPGFTQQKVVPPSLTLQAIMQDNEDSSALINGKIYSVGSFVHDHKVMDIGSNFVILQQGTSLRQLTLPHYKQPVSSALIEEVQKDHP